MRLLPTRIPPMTSRAIDGHHQASSIPANLLREKNQETHARSRTAHRHPAPADLLLMSQQDKTQAPTANGKKVPTPSNNDERHRSHKTPNKENVEHSHTKRHERATPTSK